MQDILKRDIITIGMRKYYMIRGSLEYVEDWIDVKIKIPKKAQVGDPEYPKCNECSSELSMANYSNYNRKCVECGSKFIDTRYK